MHKHVGSGSTILDLVKNKQYTEVRYFNNEFSLENWNKYANTILETDIDSYMVISKIYECYAVVSQFERITIETSSKFGKSGIVNYKKRYDRFEKKYGYLVKKKEEDVEALSDDA